MAASTGLTGADIPGKARALAPLFRDAHTVHQHITSSPKTFEIAGQILLRLDPALPGY